MQDKLNAKNQNSDISKAIPKAKIIVGLTAVVVTLVAIFPLASWAEAAEWHHMFQHVLIFLAGVGLGSSVFSNYLKSPKSSGEKS